MPQAGRRGESWLLVLLLVALGRSERTAAPARLSLRGSWRLSNGNGSLVLRGDVPGCAHTALLRQGLIQSKNDPTSTFNDANLFQSVADLFIAATDTVNATLQWGLLLMVTHPDIQEKVQKELEDTFGSSPTVSYQDWKKVPYTVAVIHESQRFKSILFAGNPRACLQDVTILGSFIPKGTTIVPDINSILYDPKIWETPRKFNPNHFLDKDGKFVSREELLIFGAGARECPGKEMAKMELFIFFTSLLRAFTFKPAEGVTEIKSAPRQGLVYYPHPYKFCAVPRFSES